MKIKNFLNPYDKILTNNGSKDDYFDGIFPNIKNNLDDYNKFCDPNFEPSNDIVDIPKVKHCRTAYNGFIPDTCFQRVMTACV